MDRRPDGTGARRLTTGPASDSQPNWLPDSSGLVFASTRDGNSEIYRMSRTGAHQTRITDTPEPEFGPTVSPDGTSLTFGSAGPAGFDVFVSAIDGSSRVDLTADAPGFNARPDWQARAR